MKRHIMLILLFLSTIALCFADGGEFVLVDTLFVEPSPMSGSIYFNMQDGHYSYYPQLNSLEIGYARSAWGNPGIQEFRAFASFQSQPIPSEYHIESVALHLYCQYYVDCSNDLIWPNYYGTAYPVRVDHVQYETIAPVVFDQTPLEVCVAVLQDSAYIGWVSADVTESYLGDIQESRARSQYCLRFPSGYDVSGYQADYVSYSKGPVASPMLIVSYHKWVSNADSVIPVQIDLIQQIYPQPARDVLNLELTQKDNGTVELYLYDLRGRLLQSESRVHKDNGIAQLTICDAPSGVYFLKIKDRHTSQVKKITILR